LRRRCDKASGRVDGKLDSAGYFVVVMILVAVLRSMSNAHYLRDEKQRRDDAVYRQRILSALFMSKQHMDRHRH